MYECSMLDAPLHNVSGLRTWPSSKLEPELELEVSGKFQQILMHYGPDAIPKCFREF